MLVGGILLVVVVVVCVGGSSAQTGQVVATNRPEQTDLSRSSHYLIVDGRAYRDNVALGVIQEAPPVVVVGVHRALSVDVVAARRGSPLAAAAALTARAGMRQAPLVDLDDAIDSNVANTDDYQWNHHHAHEAYH